jgi:hypothetical protein
MCTVSFEACAFIDARGLQTLLSVINRRHRRLLRFQRFSLKSLARTGGEIGLVLRSGQGRWFGVLRHHGLVVRDRCLACHEMVRLLLLLLALLL